MSRDHNLVAVFCFVSKQARPLQRTGGYELIKRISPRSGRRQVAPSVAGGGLPEAGLPPAIVSHVKP
jgi:hypothetical protein